LHDIGKIPLNAVLPSDYLQAIAYSRSKNIPLHEVETKMFELNHSDLGYRIAELWKLSKNLKNTIRFHHNLHSLDSTDQKLVATIALANNVTNRATIGFSGNSCPDNNEEEIFNITGLTWRDVDRAESNAEETIKKAEVFLKIS
ncbi:MAG: HDOD domain-containing protein, partial [Spirochaetes bacterium]|nr:HDOD domain-containing protein [Spirochaetota bacterium]